MGKCMQKDELGEYSHWMRAQCVPCFRWHQYLGKALSFLKWGPNCTLFTLLLYATWPHHNHSSGSFKEGLHFCMETPPLVLLFGEELQELLIFLCLGRLRGLPDTRSIDSWGADTLINLNVSLPLPCYWLTRHISLLSLAFQHYFVSLVFFPLFPLPFPLSATLVPFFSWPFITLFMPHIPLQKMVLHVWN